MWILNSKKFTEETGREYFLKHYASYCDTLSKDDHRDMVMIQMSGGSDVVQSAFRRNYESFPLAQDSFWLYRGGDMHPDDRQFIAASFLYEKGLYFAHGKRKKCHPILVLKGAKLLPVICLNDFHGNPECEVVINQRHLHFRGLFYVYD